MLQAGPHSTSTDTTIQLRKSLKNKNRDVFAFSMKAIPYADFISLHVQIHSGTYIVLATHTRSTRLRKWFLALGLHCYPGVFGMGGGTAWVVVITKRNYQWVSIELQQGTLYNREQSLKMPESTRLRKRCEKPQTSHPLCSVWWCTRSSPHETLWFPNPPQMVGWYASTHLQNNSEFSHLHEILAGTYKDMHTILVLNSPPFHRPLREGRFLHAEGGPTLETGWTDLRKSLLAIRACPSCKGASVWGGVQRVHLLQSLLLPVTIRHVSGTFMDWTLWLQWLTFPMSSVGCIFSSFLKSESHPKIPVVPKGWFQKGDLPTSSGLFFK